MTKFKTILLAAALAAPGTFLAAGATAQVSGIAVADPEAAVANSKAWAAARQQIQTTYKAQIDQASTRRTAIENELRPMVTKLQNDQKNNVAQATLQQQYQAIQTKQQAAQQELGRITQPAERAQAYALEQISAKLPDAVNAVVRAKNVSLLVRPAAAMYANPAADVTSAITAELDRAVPTVGITPPAGWQPGQQQQAAAAAAPASNTKAPQGR